MDVSTRSKRKRGSSPESSASTRKRKERPREKDNGYEDFNKALNEDFEALWNTSNGETCSITLARAHVDYSQGTTTVYHIWHAHKSYMKLHSDPAVLAYHLTCISHNLTQHLAAVAKNCREQQLQVLREDNKTIADIGQAKVDDELSRTQRAVGRIFISLLHGLNALCKEPQDSLTSVQSSVIYSYAQAFDTILTIMSTTLTIYANGIENYESIGNRKSNPKGKSGKGRSVEVVSSTLNTLLLAIIASLDPMQRSHGTLFEAILYIILSRVGTRLFFFTFNHERSETVDGDIVIPFPQARASGSTELRASQKVAIIEGKYLIQLLARAMTLAPSFLGSILSPSSTARLSRSCGAVNRASASKPSAAKSALTLLAKQKLQRTLIDAMFGNDDTQNEFIERLAKQKPFPPIAAPPRIDDEDVPTWFCEQVWRLVGWELLEREEDL